MTVWGDCIVINEQALYCLINKCDIYFENSLISKEQIIRKYANFFVSSLCGKKRSVTIALHTGSICFSLISSIMTTLVCLSLDETDAESIIYSLNENDIVLFKNRRYRWCGLDFISGNKYMVLEQDGHGKSGNVITKVPFEMNKNLIKPYYGPSKLTDGRGIKRKDDKGIDFVSHMFGIQKTEIPSIMGTSVVIVAKRRIFEHLSRGLRINYGDGKNIGLLDIVTASYYTDSGGEYQYGNNPARTEPVLKIAGKISTARDLVLNKHGNVIAGLLVVDTDAASKGSSELTDLLGRKNLKFAHVAVEIDSKYAVDIVESQEHADVFACTREFLLKNFLPVQDVNDLTLELDRQVGNIINNIVETEIVVGGCSWEDLRKAKEALYVIKRSEWDESVKKTFIIGAYSLLNLFITAVFPIETLEKTIEGGKLKEGISSPILRIQELWNLADKAESVEYHCAYVIDVLERLYESGFSDCSKYDVLKQHIESSAEEKIVVVVPKAYYVDILRENNMIYKKDISIITANRFDTSMSYDRIIVVGDFDGKRFDPLRCGASAYIIVLLYECETHRFRYKEQKAKIFEKKLNSGLYTISDEISDDGDEMNDDIGFENMDVFVEEETDLEEYIENISIFDIKKYVEKVSGSMENTLTSEVYAVGRFTSGEQILFSKYYKAVVFDPTGGTTLESDIEHLSEGDQLVFAKRDDYTRNMVDYIYESLQITGRLSADVLDATEKAAYWKEALREYKFVHGLSYKDIARRLRRLGSSLQEASVRQWLIEESHIVGPRDEDTLRQIAELTGDFYLLDDTHSFFEACRIVRRQRKEILGLIGKAIEDKLSGSKPPVGGILEVVYDNVENLSEILELAAITLLEEPVVVPVNLINKPITDWGL